MNQSSEIILYFDGVCSLCNSTIDFFIRKDKNKIFRYSALQGKSAKSKLDPKYVSDLNTVVLYIDGEVLTKSKAIIKALSLLGLPYSIMGVFRIIPSIFTDFFYSLISKYRYKIFGIKESCRLPTHSEKELFLD